MIKIGIIGYGYWGPNLVRNFVNIDSKIVKTVADSREERLKALKKVYPYLETTTNPDDIFKDKEINCVVIATPVYAHYPLCKKALEAGKHVLIEKPMTASTEEALKLIDLAQKKKKVLMVDHTFLYTGAVKKIKELISKKELGDIKYFDSIRINLGLFQSDVNVLWDLAPHDISILHHIMGEKPYSVVATGTSHTHNRIENLAYITLYFKSDKIAHFTCSWSSPVKIRKIFIGGSKKMVVFDDIEPTEKLKVYDTSYNLTCDEKYRQKMLVDYRVGDIHIPKIEQTEALAGVAKDFISAVTKGTTPISDWKCGLEVVKILEASEKSIKNKGKEIVLN